LLEQGKFTPLTLNEFSVLKTTFASELAAIDCDLSFNPQNCCRLIETMTFQNKEINPAHVWFADFECDTQTDLHEHLPYLCVCSNAFDTEFHTFYGPGCALQFLEFMKGDSIVYFHNLAYDIRMLAKYGLQTIMEKGTQVKRGTIEYKNKFIEVRDSLALLTTPLKNFPAMFYLKDIQKEVLPYNYYTIERLEDNVGYFDELTELSPKDLKLMKQNCLKIGCLTDELKGFDMMQYAQFYCEQDVRILKQGVMLFRQQLIDAFKLDPFDFVSISSIAYAVFKHTLFYTNGNLFEVGGIV
jgi:hypothetical protein